MNIIEAVNKMRCGERIRLPNWDVKSYVTKQNDGRVIYCQTETGTMYKFSDGEVLADDWEIYIEPDPHTFEEALMAYKCGNTIIRNIDRPEQARNIEDIFSCFFSRSDLLAVDWIILDK